MSVAEVVREALEEKVSRPKQVDGVVGAAELELSDDEVREI